MRIVIAEDEVLERKKMKKFIEQHFSDMEIVGEAANGRVAIELAKELKPDIIFMDIKMPGINGLEAIEQINKINPTIKFILLSAYDSFDYAKEAMHFGIKDYILKPGKKNEIIKALNRVTKEIKMDRMQEDERERSEQYMRERLILNTMRHPVSAETVELQKKLLPDMKNGCFFVAWVNGDQGIQMAEAAIRKTMDKSSITIENDNVLVVLITASTKLKKVDLVTAAKNLQLELDPDCYVGIGSPYSSLDKLPNSYHEAYTACLQLKDANKRNYGFIEKGEGSEKISDVITKISNGIEKGNSNEAIFQLNKYDHLFSQKDYENLYFVLRNLLLSRNLSLPDRLIASLKTPKDWHAFLELCALKITELHSSRQYINQVKSYIRSHYHEAITLEDAAEMVNLSPNYFSNMFKQELGETFMDFLTSVRLHKAKELIEENKYTLKEISYMVGYKNPDYFSRVFKKHFHISPRYFQKEIFKNGSKT